jgi:hypothetical protein
LTPWTLPRVQAAPIYHPMSHVQDALADELELGELSQERLLHGRVQHAT